MSPYIAASYAFIPAIAFFIRFVAKEPLRIILFMIGAFFWLCSLLITSIEWRFIILLTASPVWTLIIFLINQEIARLLFFVVARKAYDGLTKLGSSNKIVIPEVELLSHSSRHTFAFICGLGFGTIACFFSVANVIADLTFDGVPGFPASVEKNDCPIHRSFDDVDVPYSFAAACSIVIFLNAAWTILQWDSCHKFLQAKNATDETADSNETATALPKLWWLGIVFGVISHFLNSALSLLSPGGWHWYVLGGQCLLLLLTTVLTIVIVGFNQPQTWKEFVMSPSYFFATPSSAIVTSDEADESSANANEVVHHPSPFEISNNVAPEAV